MVKNNQIISDDERKAIKELSELIDELNVTEIEIQNDYQKHRNFSIFWYFLFFQFPECFLLIKPLNGAEMPN